MTEDLPQLLAALAWLAIPLGLAWAVWRWPAWRLRRALARPLTAAQIETLRRYVPPYARMDAALQQQLQQRVQQFLYEKEFVGCAGLEVDDTMRVAIAGQACLLVLNRPSRVFPELRSILVYPTAFLVPRREVDAAGVVSQHKQTLLGESWSDGRVVLSWDHVCEAARDWQGSHSVVLHEFAHQLDSESGSNNGAPYLGHPDSYRRWAEVLSRAYAHLRIEAMHGAQGVLDHYGASSPAEFFAVVTEAFFQHPWALAEDYPDLFAEFQQYYRVDPRAWSEAPQPEPGPVLHFSPVWYGPR
ncbi:zinc-dependent peptidase [Massilia sp. TS11]|uniref:M90 family metallopeptidase n=1 Tax=Massilia sp. TS11 TaxID=2908003 RepID=UPI001EDA4EA3|nr:M90 family metallopeptidase [Massilia sp. TS11]MCG2584439.1 zinc-dependent peptidase [Massilia sp. TS11]